MKRNTTTKNGNRVVILSVSNGKIIANVYPVNNLSNVPTMYKYNEDGTLYGSNNPHPMDLELAA